MRTIAYAVLRLYCADCSGIIWAWQARCRSSHRSCQHAAMLRIYQANHAMTPDSPFPMWKCSGCGQVPA